VAVAALPAIVLRLEFHLVASAGGAGDAVRPAAGHHVFPAVLLIGKSDDSLLKGLRFGCHDLIARQIHGIVKYIITRRNNLFLMT